MKAEDVKTIRDLADFIVINTDADSNRIPGDLLHGALRELAKLFGDAGLNEFHIDQQINLIQFEEFKSYPKFNGKFAWHVVIWMKSLPDALIRKEEEREFVFVLNDDMKIYTAVIPPGPVRTHMVQKQ